MMASARAEPIWGRASSCSLLAVLMSIKSAWDGAVVVVAGVPGVGAAVVAADAGFPARQSAMKLLRLSPLSFFCPASALHAVMRSCWAACAAEGWVAGAVLGAGAVFAAGGFAVVSGAAVCASAGAASRKPSAAKVAGRDTLMRLLLQG